MGRGNLEVMGSSLFWIDSKSWLKNWKCSRLTTVDHFHPDRNRCATSEKSWKKSEKRKRTRDRQTQKKTIKRKRIKTSHYNWYEMIWNDNGRVWAVCSGVGFPVWNSVWNFDSSSSFFFDWLVGWLVLSFFLSCFWCYLSTSQTWNRHFISVTFCLMGNHLVARTRFGPAAQWKASSDNIHLNCWIVEPIQWMYDNIKTLSDRIDGNLESCDGCYTPLHTDTPKCVHSSHQRNK